MTYGHTADRCTHYHLPTRGMPAEAAEPPDVVLWLPTGPGVAVADRARTTLTCSRRTRPEDPP
jgi:hypothetical protein